MQARLTSACDVSVVSVKRVGGTRHHAECSFVCKCVKVRGLRHGSSLGTGVGRALK